MSWNTGMLMPWQVSWQLKEFLHALTIWCSERFEPKAMRVPNDKFGKRFKRSDHRCHGPRWNPPIRPLLNRPTIAPVRLSLGQVGQASLTAIEAEGREAVKIGHGSSETQFNWDVFDIAWPREYIIYYIIISICKASTNLYMQLWIVNFRNAVSKRKSRSFVGRQSSTLW